MKKFWKYLTIVILLLLGLFCIGILYLFFVPGSSLFNISYISHFKDVLTKQYATNDIQKIVVESNKYPVTVLTTESNKAYLKAHDNSFGFVLSNHKTLTVNVSKEKGVLTFVVDEPYGASFDNMSHIELYIPQSKALDLKLSNNNAKTNINSKTINLKNFQYSTDGGDITISNVTITGSLNLELNNADCSIDKSTKLNNADVKLSLNTGKFTANDISFDEIDIVKNTHGSIEIKSCNLLTNEIESAGGHITAKQIKEIDVETSDTNISIDKVTSRAQIVLTKSGSINIKEIGEFVTSQLETYDGSINITKSNASLYLKSTHGNITVNDATYVLDIDNEYGDVNVNFNKKAPTYESNPILKARTLVANVKNGKLTATGVDRTKITLTKNARADITFNKINGYNEILGANGSVIVKLDKNLKYKLTTKTDSGSVRVNLAQISQYNGYTTKEETKTFVNQTEADFNASDNKHELKVSTIQGGLTVLDSYFY